MDFYREYKSGLKLVACKLENFHTVSAGIFVDVGSVKENAETNGYSHLIEHMLFKGTSTRTSLEISEEIDDMGAVINAYTAKDYTCFYTKSLDVNLEKCLDILSDIYFNATFPQDELEKEKAVVLEEIKMCSDTPDDVSQDLIQSALFYSQPLGQTILGNSDNIRYSDRHSIMKFKDRNYFSGSTVVAVCGNFDIDELDRLTEKYFESNFRKTSSESKSRENEPDVTFTSRFLHVFKDIEQSHIQIAWENCSSDSPNRFANNILCSILGGGLTSRLYQTIREKHGLAYSVYSYPSYYLKGGSFEIYAGLSPSNNVKACELIFEEISKLLSDGVTQKEVDRAKIQAVNSLYMATENNMTLMRLYGKTMLKRSKMFNAEEEARANGEVSLKDVNEAAKRILTKPFASSYVGPKIPEFDAVSKRRP